MDVSVAESTPQLKALPKIFESAVVAVRSTGEVVDAVGDLARSSEVIARAVAIAAAVLSSLEPELGARLLKIEVDYTTANVAIYVDRDVLKISVVSMEGG
ncbi:MAG: hypothetical protein N3G79_02350 [Sulfolobales archaeon]|nr:hypothetical protein [Sulfolobales archaeon]